MLGGKKSYVWAFKCPLWAAGPAMLLTRLTRPGTAQKHKANSIFISVKFPSKWEQTVRWVSQKKSPPVWSKHSQSTPVTAKLPNLISFVWGAHWLLQPPSIHSFDVERKGWREMPLLYKVTFSGLLLRPNSEAIFQTLLVWSVRRKRGRKRGARITGSYSENCLAARTRLGWKGGKGLHCPLTDKWTGSIDCKVFWWGGRVGPVHNSCFSIWHLESKSACLAHESKDKSTNPPPSPFLLTCFLLVSFQFSFSNTIPQDT